MKLNGKSFITVLLAVPILGGCGPGLSTDPAPVILVTKPSGTTTVTKVQQVFTGSCYDGLPIALGYSSNISGPSTTDCVGGQFQFTTSLVDIGGSRTVSLAQLTKRGTLGTTSRTFTYARGTATGFTLPYPSPSFAVTTNPSNGLADSLVRGGVNALAVDTSGNVQVGGAFDKYLAIGVGYGTTIFADGSFSQSQRFNDFVNTIVPIGDGSGDYYVGGQFTTYLSSATNASRLVRINGTTGAQSSVFTNLGFTGTMDAGAVSGVNAIALVGDGTGDIYVAGNFQFYGGTEFDGMVRLTSSGAISTATTFNTNIQTSGTSFSSGSLYALAMSADGTFDVFVGGSFTQLNGVGVGSLVRLTPAGVQSALSYSPVTGVVRALLTLPTHQLAVGGSFTSYGGTATSGFICLENDGSALGTGLNANVGAGFAGAVNALALGNFTGTTIIAAGNFISYDITAVNRIVRIVTATGAIDTTFVVGTGFDGGSVHSLAVDSSGNVWAGGAFSAYNGYGANGFLELQSNGLIVSTGQVGAGFDGPVTAIVPANDGSGDSYFAGTFTHYNGTSTKQIARLRSTGALAASFLSLGFDGNVDAILMAPDGSGNLIVGGEFANYGSTAVHHLTSLDSTGALVSSFLTTVNGGSDDDIFALASANDGTGNFYAGGAFLNYGGSAYQGLARLTATGSPDPSFSTTSGFNLAVRAVAVLPSGVVVAGGDFTAYGGTAADHLVFLDKASGSFEGHCNSPFPSSPNYCDLDGTVRALTVDSNANVYVGGDFTHYDTATAAPYLYSITSTGTLNTTFAVGSALNAPVRALAISGDSTGDILVGGDFTTYQGSAQKYYVRLTKAGVLDTYAASISAGYPDSSVYAIAPESSTSPSTFIGGLFRTFNGKVTDSLASVLSIGLAN